MATDWKKIIATAKESQGKSIDISQIGPTDAERTLALFMKKSGDYEGCLKIFRTIGNYENLRSLAAAIVQHSPKEGPLIFNETKLKQMYDGVSLIQLENLANESLRKNKPETPFNGFRSVAEHPKVSLLRREPGYLVYMVFGTKEKKVSLVNRKEGYGVILEILKDLNGTIRGEESFFFDWDDDAVALAQVLVTYYSVQPSHGQVSFTKRTLEFSKYIPQSLLWIGTVFDTELDKRVNTWSGTYLPLRASGIDDELAITYAWIMENGIHKKSKDLLDLIKGVNDEVKNYQKIVTNPLDIKGAVDDLSKRRDVRFADMKDSLIKSSEFLRQFVRIDKLYDDAMMEKDFFHLSEAYWGTAHMLQLTRILLDKLHTAKVKMDHVDIMGSAGPGVAAALNLVQAEAPYSLLYEEGVAKSVHAPGKPEHVEGWKMHGYGLKDKVPKQPTDGVRLTIWSEITETNDDEKDLAIMNLLKPEFRGVLVVGYTMMTARNFGRITDAATKAGFVFDIWKHPRLDNDRIYWIFSNASSPYVAMEWDESVVAAKRDKMIKDTYANDTNKRVLIAAGSFPVRSVVKADVAETDAFYLTLAVPAQFKPGMAKREKTGVDESSDMLRRLKLARMGEEEKKGTTGDNNNNKPEPAPEDTPMPDTEKTVPKPAEGTIQSPEGRRKKKKVT